MKVLKSVIKLLFYSGVSFIPQPYKWYIYLEIWCILCVSLLWMGLIYRITENRHNISMVLMDLFNITSISGAGINFIVYKVKKFKFLELYNNIKMMVEKEKTEGEFEIYRAVEFQIRKYVKILTILFFISVGFYIIFPMIQIFYKHLLGTYDVSQRQLPTPINAFYDLSKSPAYEITYLINASAMIALLFFIASIDLLYMGIALYIVAGYKVLQKKIKKIDSSDNSTKTDYNFIRKKIMPNISDYNRFQERIKKIIQLHGSLLSYEELHQQIYSEIIFASIGACLITISSGLFQISTKLDNIGDVVVVLLIVISAYAIIFLNCYFGHLVTIEGENVADAAYNSLWYLRSPRERKYFLLIILISQRTRYISGLNYYKCTMETFANVCKATFSIIAIMQNIEGK